VTEHVHDPLEQERDSGPTGPVIRDKRRLDPETGQLREQPTPTGTAPDTEPGEQTAPEGGSGDGTGEAAEHPDTVLAAERLEDLRRLQAEYMNYKRRVERDRAHDRDLAVASVVEALLPVLDDIHSAREHGDLEDGPFVAIAEKLEDILGRLGAEKLGAVGEEFDPNVHEALMRLSEEHLPEGATGTTIVQVMQPGFRVGERLVRAARVAVAQPDGE
jgi:molecular chaperone GrpE